MKVSALKGLNERNATWFSEKAKDEKYRIQKFALYGTALLLMHESLCMWLWVCVRVCILTQIRLNLHIGGRHDLEQNVAPILQNLGQ